jgi:addiction module HigA family antidote
MPQESPPPHPGSYIKQQVLPAGMTVTAAAKRLGVGRPALSNLLNGNASLSSDMAMRMQKAFGESGEALLKMQAAYDRSLARAREPEIAVRSYSPSFLDIKAIQIQAWADRIETRAELGALLRRLVASTGKDLTKVDFPAYENSQRPGWDGNVVAGSATPWIPLGVSGWEFGVNHDVSQKAEQDYRARTLEVSADARIATTFVFVTPRNWPGKNTWASAKRATAKWKDIRVYDASDLEQWLEDSVPAQAWMSERLPLGISPIQSLDACWKAWAGVTNPELSKALFRPTAEASGKKLAEWLERPAGDPFTVVADSEEEALAALVCAFESEALAETNAGDRVVVLRSADAMAKVAIASSNFVAVLASAEAERESSGLHHTHHVIVVTRRNAVEGDPGMTVDLVDDTTFREALETMGFENDDIDRLGRESGHSQTVLRRRLAKLPAIKSPPWATQPDITNRLIPLVFVGAWDSTFEADQAIVSDLAAVPYDTIEKTVAELVGEGQSPVWSIGQVRGVVSKTDAFYAVQRLVTSADLHRFFKLARVVLSESDPALELPEDKRWASNLYGKSRRHSAIIREGLCETLVLLAVHGDNLFKDRLGFNVEVHVNELIRDLLTPLDPLTWQSQRKDLPRYAEAAPDVFLDILDQDLRSDEPKVYALMQPTDSGPFSSPGRTGLLWALETLAWNPRWLFHVVTILAKLSELKVDDNWINKPENSLASIFRCWMPQTAATIDKRLEALDLLIRKNAGVGWRICVNQFDQHSTVGHYSSRPRWRRDAAGAGEVVTNLEAYQMARRAVDRAIGWATHTEYTLGDLVEHLGRIPDDQEAVWAQVIAWAATNPADACKATLRERIRRSTMTVQSHRQRGGVAVPPRAHEAYEALVPDDIVLRHQWLFAQQWVHESADEIMDEDLDFEKREERISSLRETTLREIWRTAGHEGIARLCDLSEAPYMVGWHLASGVFDADQAEQFAVTVVGHERAQLNRKMDSCLSGMLSRLSPAVRETILANSIKDFPTNYRYSPAGVAHLMHLAPFGAGTWKFVDVLPQPVRQKYWRDISPSRFFHEDAAEANRVVDELLRADRPRAAFNTVEMVFAKITSDRLTRLLVEAATNRSEPAGHNQLAPHDISDAFKELSRRSDVTQEELARLEFLYIEALSHTEHGIKNLECELATSPQLFLQALVFAFRRNDEGEDPPELRPGNQDTASGLASAAYRLLSSAKRLPGTNDDGEVDARKLRDWVTQVRMLTHQHAREAVGDSIIGQLLASSPEGAGGMWPSEPVREVLEDIGTAEMANGMMTGRYNARGPHFRAPGGGAERDLAAQYREQSAGAASRYPFTARMLKGLASMYDRDAEWQDTEAKTRKRLRH